MRPITWLLPALVFLGLSLVACNEHSPPPSIGSSYSGPIPRPDEHDLTAATGQVGLRTPAGYRPVAEATVVAVEQGGLSRTFTTITDSTGDFVLSRLPVGRYRLGFAGPGCAAVLPESIRARELIARPDRTNRLAAVGLAPASPAIPAIRIAGTARAAPGDRSPAGLEVDVPGIDRSFVDLVTDPATGIFELTVPALGNGKPRTIALVFSAPGHRLAVVPDVVVPDGGRVTLPADVVLQPIPLDREP
ncbi:MAG: carboxypeptidase regulatory-like domain-containing protein [Candidatus Riflebacteria bacterium]|nr:carboxypeptidase regulatory-like domain-containing protein [Candidatus Riflebacteria bacterium]